MRSVRQPTTDHGFGQLTGLREEFEVRLARAAVDMGEIYLPWARRSPRLDCSDRSGDDLKAMFTLPTSPSGYPMAPSQEDWDRLSPQERQEVFDSLPAEVTDAEAMPEGDRHFGAKVRALDTLRSYFTRNKRRIYLASELPTYYPGAPRFAPDLLAVVDADTHERDKWVVSGEGKGLDWVMEVHVGGDRKKDAEANVVRYAQLGIPEYFLYDRARQRLYAYRLPSAKARVYSPIVPQFGKYESRVLGLELQLEGERLRFFSGTALLLETEELVTRLEQLLGDVQQRLEDEARMRQDEARMRQEAERQLAEALAELERLKK